VPVQNQRLQSLDVFRGGTIAAMIMVNNQASDQAYTQLEHAHWHGWTFLLASGCSRVESVCKAASHLWKERLGRLCVLRATGEIVVVN
jgi:predicted acyltransferase